MSGKELQRAPEVTLLKSEVEAAAARVAERAMNATFDGVAGLVGDVFGGLFGDSIKQWRTRRLVTALARTKDHLEAQGISLERAKHLPMGELYGIFEGASKTEDLDLTSMWAALLSNAMNPEKDSIVDPTFVRILDSLSGLDARILNYNLEFQGASESHRAKTDPALQALLRMQDRESAEFAAARKEYEVLEDEFRRRAEALRDEIGKQYSEQNISYSISNLLRLGLFHVPDMIDRNRALIEIKEDRFGERLILDEQRLRSELMKIREKFEIAAEKNKELHTISENARLFGNIPVPKYALTGLGRRFLEACA